MAHIPPQSIVGDAQPCEWLAVYEITPELATELLLRNSGNRKLRPGVVDRYAEDLRNGRWHFLGDPLVFDEDGKLRQGQHRLHAIVKSGESMRLPIITNVSRRAFAAIDTGTRRTTSDQLRIVHGVSNSANIAALIPRYLDLVGGRVLGTHSRQMSPTAIVAWYEDHPESHQLLNDAVRTSCAVNDKLYAPPSITGACYAWIKDVDPEGADDFFRRCLIDGHEWIHDGSPARTLGQYMAQHRGLSNRDYEHDLAWSIIRCWNAWATGEQIRVLRPRKDGELVAMKPPMPRGHLVA